MSNINKKQRDAEALESLIASMWNMVNRQSYRFDQTFISVVKNASVNGTYVIIDNGGIERTVKSSVPGLPVQAGKNVWVKIPSGDINRIHICGIV